MWCIIFLFLGFILGRFIGWESAHQTVAKECQRLGSFYVGKTVFKCYEVINHQDNSNTKKLSGAKRPTY